MEINQINTAGVVRKTTQGNNSEIRKKQPESVGVQQFSSEASRASLAYGLARLSSVTKVQAPIKQEPAEPKRLNFFYFSDTHGELGSLSKLASAKEACEECCGGADKLTVLGAGDLIAGSQEKVINATVDVVNNMGMAATAMGNHERSRSNAKLDKLTDDLKPELLAINSSKEEQEVCDVRTSMICKQGDTEFILVGAQPLSPIQNPQEIADAIDKEVAGIKEERAKQGLNTDLPVIFLSHMGSDADKHVAEHSSSVNLILGGHTHNVEDNTYTGNDGRSVQVLQGGKNNQYATAITMDIAPDGKITSSAKMIDLTQDVEHICADAGKFYGTDGLSENVVKAAENAEEETTKIVANSVGEKVNVGYVPEGQGYINDGRERNYCNPVSNILADAMLEATADKGVQVSFFNAPSLKDTEIPDQTSLSNYDIIGRMLPFGGDVSVADLPVDKFYDIIESRAQTVVTDESQLVQCGGMVYSVDAQKAEARYNQSLVVMKAEDDLKKIKESGGDTTQAQKALAKAKADYSELPGCVNMIMIPNPDGGRPLKIFPKGIQKGEYEGQTIKCAMNDFLAHEERIDKDPKYNCENTKMALSDVFGKGLERVREENDGNLYVDHNDIRISIRDRKDVVVGYKLPTGFNTGYTNKA